jgi:hypothetical protein
MMVAVPEPLRVPPEGVLMVSVPLVALRVTLSGLAPMSGSATEIPLMPVPRSSKPLCVPAGTVFVGGSLTAVIAMVRLWVFESALPSLTLKATVRVGVALPAVGLSLLRLRKPMDCSAVW